MQKEELRLRHLWEVDDYEILNLEKKHCDGFLTSKSIFELKMLPMSLNEESETNTNDNFMSTLHFLFFFLIVGKCYENQ